MLIAWPNKIASATLSGGSWSGSLPRANLATRAQYEVARTSDATLASTQFAMDFGAVVPLRVFALANHNLSESANWKITLGTTAGGSDLHDSGWQAVWHLSWDTGLMSWGDLSLWEGVIDDSEYLGHPYLAIYTLPAGISARYVTIEIDDTGNSAGYVQIGRAWASPALQPATGLALGFAHGWDDPSEIVTMPSGVLAQVARRRKRWMRGELRNLSADEANVIDEIQRREGLFGELIVINNPYNADELQRRAFIGRLRELSAIEWPWPRIRSTPISVEELL